MLHASSRSRLPFMAALLLLLSAPLIALQHEARASSAAERLQAWSLRVCYRRKARTYRAVSKRVLRSKLRLAEWQTTSSSAELDLMPGKTNYQYVVSDETRSRCSTKHATFQSAQGSNSILS